MKRKKYVFSFSAKAQRRKGNLPIALRLCVFAFSRFTPSLNTFGLTGS